MGEKAEGDIGGLTLVGMGPYGWDVEITGLDSDRSSAVTDFDTILGFESNVLSLYAVGAFLALTRSCQEDQEPCI